MNSLLYSKLSSKLEFLVDKQARWTVCLAVAVTLFFVVFLPQLRFENAPGKLDIPLNDPERISLENFKTQFGGGELLVIGVEFAGAIGSEEIACIEWLTDSLQQLPGVRAVHSLTNIPVLKWVPVMGIYVLRPTLSLKNHPKENDSLIAHMVGELASHSSFRENILSTKDHSTALVMTLDPWKADQKKGLMPLKRLVERIKTIAKGGLGGHANLHFAGPAILNIALHSAMRRDLVLFGPISLLAFVLVLILIFGSWRPVVLALGTSAMALIWSLAMLPLTSTPMSIGLSMMIPLIPALSLMYAVHHLCYVFQSKIESGYNLIVPACFRKLVIPGLLCGLTTCIGFLSLSSSSLPGIQEVGIFLGCGVIFSTVVANIVLPAALQLLGWQGSDTKKRVGQKFVTGIVERLQLIVLPHPGIFVITATVFVLIVGYGILNLKVETNHLAYLARDREVTEAFRFTDAQFGGVLPLEILVDLPPRPTATEITSILNLESDLRLLHGVGSVVSVADFIQKADLAKPEMTVPLRPQLDLDRGFVSPGIWKLVAQQAIGSDFLSKTDSMLTVRIACRVHMTDSDQLQSLLLRVKSLVSHHLGDHNTSVTGLSVYFARVEEYVMSTQTESFGIALASTILLLGFLSGSLRVALAVIIVNVLPVALVLGLMGWLAIPLDISTVMIASIALGIVVDDTIHLIYRYRLEYESNRMVGESLKGAFREIGLPVVTTTIILSVGFGSLMAARFVPTAYFGGLSTLTVMAAALADFLLLPALILFLMRIMKSPNSQ